MFVQYNYLTFNLWFDVTPSSLVVAVSRMLHYDEYRRKLGGEKKNWVRRIYFFEVDHISLCVWGTGLGLYIMCRGVIHHARSSAPGPNKDVGNV